MNEKKYIFLVFLISVFCFSQSNINDTIKLPITDTLSFKKTPEDIVKDITGNIVPKKIIQISPTKAGLYSAVFPGLGQVYNKKYWKVPILWGAIGTGVGIALWNNKQYKRYRRAFIAELNGKKHEFSGVPGITKEVLGRIQDSAKRQRDYAIAITSGIYLLGIIDAIVDVHLYPMKNDPEFAFAPVVIVDPLTFESGKPGVRLVYRF